MTEKAAMKKPFTLLAFREARKTLGFVLPLMAAATIIFAQQRCCSGRDEATAESQGRLSFKGWPFSAVATTLPGSQPIAGNAIETHKHAGEFKE